LSIFFPVNIQTRAINKSKSLTFVERDGSKVQNIESKLFTVDFVKKLKLGKSKWLKNQHKKRHFT